MHEMEQYNVPAAKMIADTKDSAPNHSAGAVQALSNTIVTIAQQQPDEITFNLPMVFRNLSLWFLGVSIFYYIPPLTVGSDSILPYFFVKFNRSIEWEIAPFCARQINKFVFSERTGSHVLQRLFAPSTALHTIFVS